MTEPVQPLLPQSERLWDANEAAAFLNVSRSWIYQRSEAGLLPHVRIGALLRFEPATMRDYARQDRLSATDVRERMRARR